MIRLPARRAALLAPSLFILLAACSSSGQFPTLALRDFERTGRFETGEGEAAAQAPGANGPVASEEIASDGSLDSQLAALVKQAKDANSRFENTRPAAERAVAGAGSRTSDSWSAAQIALAGLEANRAQASDALADLDQLYADSRDAAPNDISPETTAIAEARSQVAGFVSAQDSVIATLAGRLEG